MRYIVAVDRTGVHVAPVLDQNSIYSHPDFIVEKGIYTYGPEYVAAVNTSDPEAARAIGTIRILEHFPDAEPYTKE